VDAGAPGLSAFTGPDLARDRIRIEHVPGCKVDLGCRLPEVSGTLGKANYLVCCFTSVVKSWEEVVELTHCKDGEVERWKKWFRHWKPSKYRPMPRCAFLPYAPSNIRP